MAAAAACVCRRRQGAGCYQRYATLHTPTAATAPNSRQHPATATYEGSATLPLIRYLLRPPMTSWRVTVISSIAS